MADGSTPTQVREVERKYTIPKGQALPPVTDLPGARAEPVELARLVARYFDTPDLRLLRLGMTLRRREGGPDEGWHLKVPDGGARTEVRLPLDAGGAAHPPEGLTRLLRAVVRGRPLLEVAQIATERRRHGFLDGEGRDVAEVVEDRVRATVDGQTGELRWREIEVEDHTDDGGLAGTIDERLTAAGILPAQSPSKLHHALATAGRPVEPETSDGGHPLRRYLREELANLVLADVGVRLEAHESVHSMRKAARRLRSALQSYGPVLDAAERAAPLVEDLRWLGRRLSEARDVEVQHERALTRIADSPVPHREAVQARLEEFFTQRGATARTLMLETLDSARHVELLDAMEALVGELDARDARDELDARDGLDGAAPATPARRPAKRRPADLTPRAVARTLRKQARKIDTRVAKVREAASPEERDEAVHRVRKAAKRLRYAIETASPLFPKKAKRALTAFDDLQDMLGEFQDATVARAHLLEASADQGHSAESSFALGIAYQREVEIAEAQVAELRPMWKGARRRARPLWS
ncbi:CYTH and CHAD domain-containing protein [Georgenia yuyongxinii]|uniref:CYTH and CHAD domain-containing protein n=1 Tax=Georgenia yuyongxinii TaxID=2589797 RepID=A0A5B8C9H4_9MICO|nr:CYTH and CHAD domain-containing protein [Georgenia yuyongxinii]QDC26085.1 CYTH and CHAD domain-containing protein [Georgenia yuyongxinii]